LAEFLSSGIVFRKRQKPPLFAPNVAKPQAKIADASISRPAPHRSALVGHRLSPDPVEQALFLQGTIGNQATPRLVARRHPALLGKGRNSGEEQQSVGEITPIDRAPRGISWDFSMIPLSRQNEQARVRPSFTPVAIPLHGGIQTKLVVGEANDPLEHEADRVADQVMRMPEPQISTSATSPHVSRKCAACEKDDTDSTASPQVSRKCAACDMEDAETAPQTTPAESFVTPAVVHDVLRSPGRPLEPDTRAFFEPRFGCDFSRVRVHTDSLSAESARSIGALAYTVGNDIVFDNDQYSQRTAASDPRPSLLLAPPGNPRGTEPSLLANAGGLVAPHGLVPAPDRPAQRLRSGAVTPKQSVHGVFRSPFGWEQHAGRPLACR
jgi:hypothetical protein